MGFSRNLSAGEIIEQVIYYSNILKNTGEKLTNIVIMGMGEPFLNYANTLKAIDILNDEDGYKLGARRFTVSTVGIIPGIRRFTAEKRQVNLAISLHSVNDDTRSSLIPINRKYPLAELADACLEYINQTKRRISFEWAVINGVNDSVNDAAELSNWLNKFRIGNNNYSHVNLIPLNPTDGYQGTSPAVSKVNQFKDIIVQRGFPCTIRVRRGIDVYAGCGQLSAVNLV
jgi:23S rRNA (adenine2503-C2)-methyltransferase